MAGHVTAAAVANSFSVTVLNASRDDDDVVVVVVSKVANSSESVLVCIYS